MKCVFLYDNLTMNIKHVKHYTTTGGGPASDTVWSVKNSIDIWNQAKSTKQSPIQELSWPIAA